MRFAYADPPYLGNGQMYREHPRWRDADRRWWHHQLLAWLLECWPDGWALSTNPRDLRWLLPRLPADVLVSVWVKPQTASLGDHRGPRRSWEPLIVHGGRELARTTDMHQQRSSTRPYRDALILNPAWGGTDKPRGYKPPGFVVWMLTLLGFDPAVDLIDDLFPGSAIVGEIVSELRGGWPAGPDRLPLVMS